MKTLNKEPRFLITQFAEGAAGTFFLNLLSASASVGHPDVEVESNKTDHACLMHIQQGYTNNANTWLITEPRPQNPLNLHFISTRFPRGDELSYEQFVQLCETDASAQFWQSVNSNKLIPIGWHKTAIPDFFRDPFIVTILIDPASYKWYHRALWYKKYGVKENKIHLKADDPAYNQSRGQYFTQYNNPYLLDQHPFSFIKEQVLRTPYKSKFSVPENFVDSHRREFIQLSELLNPELLVQAVDRICNRFSLEPISHTFLRESLAHWKSCHDTFMPKYS